MFVDTVRLWAKGGKGGDGCCSFRREKYVPFGGPDGGNGGPGGSVILRVNPHLNNLVHLRYKPHHFAQNGQGGGGNNCTGRTGKDLLIEVPPGTSVCLLPTTDETWERAADPATAQTVADLLEPGQEFTLAKGGRSGRGNTVFKSSINKAPRQFEHGQPGERRQYLLELKSIADAGLVGFPNAGKSSLLAALSRARPKIAPYPFTTLTPMVGVVEIDDARRCTVADIPGIIEGAHAGIGLGHDFLRHIERCRVLLFVLDMAGSEGRDPREDYTQLRREVKLYDADLARRPHLVVANKMDLPGAAEHLKEFRRRTRVRVCPVSAAQGEGIPALVARLDELLQPAAP
jgi:GTPase